MEPPMAEKMQRNASESIVEFCQVSTVAGVQDWAVARSIISKSFWLLLVLVGSAVTVWQMREMLMDYLLPEKSFQSVVSSRSEFTRPFPKLTVCNFNRINVTKAMEENYDPQMFPLAFADVFPSSYHMTFEHIDHFSGVNGSRFRWEQIYENRSLRYVDAVNRFGHDCRRSIMKISIGGRDVKNFCDFARESITAFGRCFIFDFTNNSQTLPGVLTGLKMVLNPAVHQYLKDVIENNYAEEGMLMDVGYAYEYMAAAPLVLQPGTHSYIQLTAKRLEFQPEKFPLLDLPCRKVPELTVMTGDYTRRMCYYDSVLNKTISQCGCVTAIPTLKDIRECTHNETFDCFFVYMGLNAEEPSQYAQQECLDPCDGFEYVEASVTTTRYLGEFNLEGMASSFRNFSNYFDPILDCPKNATEYMNCVRNLISVDIFFPTMTMDVVTISEAQPIFTLIANVGGLLGLWTGMCMMTVVQLMYYTTLFIFKRCGNANLQRDQTSASNDKDVVFIA